MSLDKRDRQLLALLEHDARAPLSKLAKKMKVSKQVVSYRLSKLEEQKIIQGYNALIDVAKIGKTIYLIYLKLVRLSVAEEEKWMQELNKDNRVAIVAKNQGEWDLTIGFLCNNNTEADDILQQIIGSKASHVQKQLLTSEIESTYLPLQLVESSVAPSFTTSKHANRTCDEIDGKILCLLTENARISILDLAKKINMSPTGTKHRVKQLEKDKIILGYKTKINYEVLGYLHLRVLLHLSDFNMQTYSHLKEYLSIQGNIESVSRYLGYAQADFRCYVKDIQEFYKLLQELKDEFLNQYISADSMLVHSWEQIRYFEKENKEL